MAIGAWCAARLFYYFSMSLSIVVVLICNHSNCNATVFGGEIYLTDNCCDICDVTYIV